MRILFVSEYFPPKILGGGEINLDLVTKALAKKNDVSVITSFHPGLEKVETLHGVKIYRLLQTAGSSSGVKNNYIRLIKFPQSVIKEVKNLSKQLKPEIIHFVGISVIAANELKDLKIPLVATVESYPALCPKGDRIYHGKKECKTVCSFRKFISCQANSDEIGKTKNNFYLKYNPLFLSYIYSFYSRLNSSLKYSHLIAISSYIQKVLQQHGLTSTVIPNILPINHFKLNPKEGKNKKPKILYMGSLIKSKGPQVLLQAIRGINCRCELYGNGVLEKELKEIIKKNKLDAEIFGHIDYQKVPQVYAESDIVVFPSLWPEPFGRIAIEAMAAGKPVIGSDIGGIKETIDKHSGLLFPPGDVKKLRECIQELIANQKLVKEILVDSQKLVHNYSEEAVVKKLVKFYESVLS